MNNLKNIKYFVIAVIVAVIGFTYFQMNVSYNNKYTMLEMKAKASQDVSKLTFDKTWKIISGQAQVAEKERESFRETFLDIMNARTKNDSNLVFKWSQEAQIPISADLYKKIQNSIESQRESFLESQKELIDIQREANTLKHTFPASMFLSGRKDIEVKIVTSSKTEKAFEEGKEDDVNVFGK